MYLGQLLIHYSYAIAQCTRQTCADFPDPDLTFQMLREKEKENKSDQKKKDPSCEGPNECCNITASFFNRPQVKKDNGYMKVNRPKLIGRGD